MYKFFEEVKSVEDLREQYKKLVFKHHPDKGGKKEDFQNLQKEYDELFKRYGNVHRKKDGTTYTTEEPADGIADEFKDIINAIINFNVDIEICGSWVWVFRAYEYKEELKKLNFFYCSGKKAWAWTENPTKNKHRLSLEDIRRLHGSEKIKDREDKEKLLQAV